MTNRERIAATLRCERTDRPPFMEWLGTVGWEKTVERWRRESGISDLDVAAYFDYDQAIMEAPVELGPWPHFEASVLEEDDRFKTYIDWRGITMRDRKDGNTLPDYIATPVNDRAGWERYKSERMQPAVEERTASLVGFADKATVADAAVQVGIYPFGCFGTPRDILGVENLLLKYYDDPALIHDIIDTHVDIWLQMFQVVAERVQIDHVHMWEDMSGKQGSLISIAMVEEFMMPAYDRIAAFSRECGAAAFSVDSDGLVDELVDVMHKHGVNSFFPFEAQAGNDIIAYRKQYPDMSVWGGLDKRALAAGRKEINMELDRATELFALGGYLVGFDHAIPPDVPWENFKYFMDELKRMIGK